MVSAPAKLHESTLDGVGASETVTEVRLVVSAPAKLVTISRRSRVDFCTIATTDLRLSYQQSSFRGKIKMEMRLA